MTEYDRRYNPGNVRIGFTRAVSSFNTGYAKFLFQKTKETSIYTVEK